MMTFHDSKELVRKAIEFSDDDVSIEIADKVEVRLDMTQYLHNNFEVKWLSVDSEHVSVYYDQKTRSLSVHVDHPDLYLSHSQDLEELELNLDDVATFFTNPLRFAKMLVWKYMDLSLYQLGVLMTIDE